LRLEWAIRRIAQRFDFRRAKKSQFAIAHESRLRPAAE
jgi:hypothetical protein